MRPFFLLVLAALVVAGCADGPASSGDETAGPVAATTSTTAPLPPRPPEIDVGVCNVTSGVSWGVSGYTYNSLQAPACPFAKARPGDLTNRTAALVEVVWTPGPSVTGAGMLIESDHCRSRASVDASGLHQEQCNWGNKSGKSPMSLLVPNDILAQAGNDNLTVTVLPEGATVSQSFTIYVSVFEAAVPSDYTAIPA